MKNRLAFNLRFVKTLEWEKPKRVAASLVEGGELGVGAKTSRSKLPVQTGANDTMRRGITSEESKVVPAARQSLEGELCKCQRCEIKPLSSSGNKPPRGLENLKVERNESWLTLGISRSDEWVAL